MEMLTLSLQQSRCYGDMRHREREKKKKNSVKIVLEAHNSSEKCNIVNVIGIRHILIEWNSARVSWNLYVRIMQSAADLMAAVMLALPQSSVSIPA